MVLLSLSFLSFSCCCLCFPTSMVLAFSKGYFTLTYPKVVKFPDGVTGVQNLKGFGTYSILQLFLLSFFSFVCLLTLTSVPIFLLVQDLSDLAQFSLFPFINLISSYDSWMKVGGNSLWSSRWVWFEVGDTQFLFTHYMLWDVLSQSSAIN